MTEPRTAELSDEQIVRDWLDLRSGVARWEAHAALTRLVDELAAAKEEHKKALTLIATHVCGTWSSGENR